MTGKARERSRTRCGKVLTIAESGPRYQIFHLVGTDTAHGVKYLCYYIITDLVLPVHIFPISPAPETSSAGQLWGLTLLAR